MTNKKCPKCGSRSFRIRTKAVVYYLFRVTDGIVEPDGIDDETGDTLSETCICDCCGHQWHPRNLNKDFEIDKD